VVDPLLVVGVPSTAVVEAAWIENLRWHLAHELGIFGRVDIDDLVAEVRIRLPLDRFAQQRLEHRARMTDLDVEGFDKTLDIKRVGKNIDKLLKLREQFFVEVTKSEDRLRAFAKDINSVNKSEVKKYPQKLQEDLRLLEKNIYCKDFLAVMLRTYLSIFKSELFSIVQREETMGKYVVIYEKFNTVYTYFRAYDKLMYKELVKLKTELEEEVQI